MQSLPLPGTGLALSRIAFGSASLHHLASRRSRCELLYAALDRGITHFDTSPYYGDGVGESTLAVLPHDTTIATKVGLFPRGGAHGVAWRAQVRRAVGRFVPALTRPLVDFSVRTAAGSLDDSLRRLSRERVDLLFLHEPRADLLATDEWRGWLERERDRIGAFGVAGEAANLLPVLDGLGDTIRVIQTRDSLARQEAAPLRRIGRAPQITYGHLAQRDPAQRVGELLRATAASHADTVLLVSTRRSAHLAELAAAAAT